MADIKIIVDSGSDIPQDIADKYNIAVIPILASGIFGAQVGFGGTSIIIIVGVILETLETIKSMVTEKNYSTIKGIF